METLTLPKIKKNGSRNVDGYYPSDPSEQKVVEWIKYVLLTRHDPPLSKPWTIHLDQLIGTPTNREEVAAVSFHSFQILVEQMEAMGISDSMMPSLYIPLVCAETLDICHMDRRTLVPQIDYNEPPSLYLTDRTLQTLMRPIERYVFPLRATEFLETSRDIFVYYTATRSLEDIEHGWEYGRSIVAEYYPPTYQNLS